MRVRALLTTVTGEYDRISMHGVRRTLLERQAAAVGLPVTEVVIPPACANDLYEERFAGALTAPPLAGVDHVAFGDLFLADVRAYRERLVAACGRQALFPLWGRPTAQLASEFLADGFEAVLVCVDPRRLDASFAGRAFDDDLLHELPAGVDPCGENGEFHTFVSAGPVFTEAVAYRRGDVVARDGFVFCDLVT